ncbi:MAG: hypothetical protein HGA74_15190 [Deltaproteobacteria bacterium]|nr:hypothetical protein [Deltaproteobacteria bacterium]
MNKRLESEISERRHAEKALKEAYESINSSPAVAFLWKNEEGWPVEFVTANVQGLFGFTDEKFISGAISYDKTIHPDDCDRVAKEVKEHSETPRKEQFAHVP